MRKLGWVAAAVALFAMGVCQATESSTLRLAREWEAKQAKAENLLGAYPLGRAIRDSDPVSFSMLVDTLAKRIDRPNQQRLIQSEMQQLVNGMIREKLSRAEDSELNWFFESELSVMKQAQKLDPIECGRTVISNQDFALNFGPRLPQDFFQQRTEKLAAIIQAAAAKQPKKRTYQRLKSRCRG